jgi:uncharacterized protein
MTATIAGFDWDEGNTAKCEKHGVAKDDIEALFRGSPKVRPDIKHSTRETRLQAIGKTEAGRWVFAVFTLRLRDGKTFIRPISARFMHAKEVQHYEQETDTSL